MLHKAAKGLCVAEHLVEARGWGDTGAKFLLVVTAGEVVYLPRSLVINFFTKTVGIGALVLPCTEYILIL